MFFLKIGTPDKVDAKSSRLRRWWSQYCVSVSARDTAKDWSWKLKDDLAQNIFSTLRPWYEGWKTNSDCIPGGLKFLYAKPFLSVQKDNQSHPIWSRAWSPFRLWWFVGHGGKSMDLVLSLRVVLQGVLYSWHLKVWNLAAYKRRKREKQGVRMGRREGQESVLAAPHSSFLQPRVLRSSSLSGTMVYGFDLGQHRILAVTIAMLYVVCCILCCTYIHTHIISRQPNRALKVTIMSRMPKLLLYLHPSPTSAIWQKVLPYLL